LKKGMQLHGDDILCLLIQLDLTVMTLKTTDLQELRPQKQGLEFNKKEFVRDKFVRNDFVLNKMVAMVMR